MEPTMIPSDHRAPHCKQQAGYRRASSSNFSNACGTAVVAPALTPRPPPNPSDSAVTNAASPAPRRGKAPPWSSSEENALVAVLFNLHGAGSSRSTNTLHDVKLWERVSADLAKSGVHRRPSVNTAFTIPLRHESFANCWVGVQVHLGSWAARAIWDRRT